MFQKRLKKLALVFFLILATRSSVLAAFNDVPSGHWAKPDVEKVVNQYSFMQGDPNGNFGGGRSLTRYEFAKTISRMTEYFNAEVDSDRKDLENIVSVMELFQSELKTLENKLNTIQDEVKEQNKTVATINELAIALGEEYTKNNANAAGDSAPATSMDARITQLEFNVDKLQHKGLFLDTFVMGAVNDVKNLGSATSKAFSGARKNLDRRKNTQENLQSINEEVQQIVPTKEDLNLHYDYSGSDLEVLQEVVE